MKNVVYMKMLYSPCNNKSLADAAGMEIVINDFGEKRVCGKYLIQREDTALTQPLPAWRAQSWRFIAWPEKQKSTVCEPDLAYLSP